MGCEFLDTRREPTSGASGIEQVHEWTSFGDDVWGQELAVDDGLVEALRVQSEVVVVVASGGC